ncbi:TetR/AcrR family transcriptional regulator [Actinomadura algeriensis]|uniref:AcrR family transcriptional regulator n=1 Tax=Actinomadura algeriensis TaxID=1679523 RepID=A0ABR9JJV8_9ACTN|nr:TetR/AcrR family transcriptional regulator [Actinomadura algeriensis]MBE1530671.1 AcrR family transcriptional regulator [Actinomadura algeriensis]
MERSELDRLLETAVRLFAELGYDGTTLQLVADAAGLDVAAVREAVGDGKAELYREVMRFAAEAEGRALESALDALTLDLPGYLRVADAYLDFYTERTDLLALWLHRWMGDAADVPGLEQYYTTPVALEFAAAVRPMIPPDLDPDHVIWTVVWCVFGFLEGGLVYSDGSIPPERLRGQGLGPRDAESVERFRAHLHAMLRRLLAPAPL